MPPEARFLLYDEYKKRKQFDDLRLCDGMIRIGSMERIYYRAITDRLDTRKVPKSGESASRLTVKVVSGAPVSRFGLFGTEQNYDRSW